MPNNPWNCVVGIDYSLTSPAICVLNGSPEFKDTDCYFLTQLKSDKHVGKIDNLLGTRYPEWTDFNDRYEKLADWTLGILGTYSKIDAIYIEDYAMAAKGKTFNIAESTGLMKYKLWKAGYIYGVVAPTTVKKTFSGKGNSNKAAMELAFTEKTKYNIRSRLELTAKQESPAADIIDAYAIALYGWYL